MSKYLMVVDANLNLTTKELTDDKVMTFGSSVNNNIVLESNFISKKHGYIKTHNNKCLLYLDTSAGFTSINDANVSSQDNDSGATELKNGTVIKIGSDVENIIMIYASPFINCFAYSIADKNRITIGRSSDCDIVLSSPVVGRSHAIISYNSDTEEFSITDSDSRCGTFVNWRRINEPCILREKDIIHIANCLLVFTSKNIINTDIITKTQGKAEIQIILKAVGLTRKIKNKLILENVNLSIGRGELIAIIGGFGSGKSTIMNALCGFEMADEGTVYLNDINLYKHYNLMKNLIGYVPQQDVLFENLTVRDMLYYSAKLRLPRDTSNKTVEETIDKALRRVKLDEKKDSLIKGLSGGQKKSVSIALELMSQQNLLFLDEPTSPLDPGSAESLMRILKNLTIETESARTILLITHRPGDIRFCDKVILMGKGGRLSFYGTPEKMLSVFKFSDYEKISGIDLNKSLYAKVEEDYYKSREINYNISPKIEDAKDFVNHSEVPPFASQLKTLSARYLKLLKNTTPRLLTVLLTPILISGLLWVVFRETDGAGAVFHVYDRTKTFLFSLACCCNYIGLGNAINEICEERTALKREYIAGLNLPAYVLSKLLIQFIVAVSQSLILTGMFAYFIGLPDSGCLFDNAFLEFFATISLSTLATGALCLVVSSVVKGVKQATGVAVPILVMQFLLSDSLIKLSGFASKISYFTISHWSVLQLELISNISALTPIPEEVSKNDIIKNFAYLFAFIVVFTIMNIFILFRVKKDSR
ncbi:hypothetical protein AGMMS49975_06240 [Clostridia bacterium]|nr:hypothetical protein AGMMS49975_06240 [Clostridia bacterium]